jgi:hypothetical protein
MTELNQIESYAYLNDPMEKASENDQTAEMQTQSGSQTTARQKIQQNWNEILQKEILGILLTKKKKIKATD